MSTKTITLAAFQKGGELNQRTEILDEHGNAMGFFFSMHATKGVLISHRGQKYYKEFDNCYVLVQDTQTTKNNEMKKGKKDSVEMIIAPDANDLNLELPAGMADAAPVAETKTEELAPAEPAIKGKRIPKYSRYTIDADGTIYNAQTGNVIKKEDKNGVMKVRLTSDTGTRDFLSAETLFNDLYQRTVIDGEPAKKAAKTPDSVELSKSQRIWLTHLQEGLDVKAILAAIEGSVESHVRNVIKDYKTNPDKQAKALKVQAIVNARDAVK